MTICEIDAHILLIAGWSHVLSHIAIEMSLIKELNFCCSSHISLKAKPFRFISPANLLNCIFHLLPAARVRAGSGKMCDGSFAGLVYS